MPLRGRADKEAAVVVVAVVEAAVAVTEAVPSGAEEAVVKVSLAVFSEMQSGLEKHQDIWALAGMASSIMRRENASV